MAGPRRRSSRSGSAGASTRRMQSRVSRKSAQRLAWEREAPGGKKAGLVHGALDEQGGEDLGLHPGSSGLVVGLGQMTETEQGLEAFEHQLNLPAVTVHAEHAGRRPEGGRQGG